GDAVRTLRHVRHRHRDQLLGLFRQRTIGEHRAAEVVERVVEARCQLLAPRGDLRGGRVVERLGHGWSPSGLVASGRWAAATMGGASYRYPWMPRFSVVSERAPARLEC